MILNVVEGSVWEKQEVVVVLTSVPAVIDSLEGIVMLLKEDVVIIENTANMDVLVGSAIGTLVLV